MRRSHDQRSHRELEHWDQVFVSRYYNWKPGSKGAYGHASSYKLKPDAPNDAVETLSKALLVPFFEKLLADGTILEYEIDEETIHTDSMVDFTPHRDMLVRVNATYK